MDYDDYPTLDDCKRRFIPAPPTMPQEALDHFTGVIGGPPTICHGTFRVDKRWTRIRFENENEEGVTVIIEPRYTAAEQYEMLNKEVES